MDLWRALKSRYYVPSEKDALLAGAWNRATRRRVPQFPRTVQFETHSACNAACVFCPYPATAAGQPKGRMPPELFHKIVDEMARHDVRRISPYLNNEPFLDPDMVEKIRTLHERIPRAKLVLTTNGSLLDEATVDGLLAADALHALYLSIQGVDREGYEASTGGALNFEDVMSNALSLIAKWKAAGGRRRFKLVITMVRTSKIDVEKAAAFWREKGVASQWTPLENRGGNTALGPGLIPEKGTMRRFARCARLFKQAYILWNGDMVLCCTDYTRRVVLGNVGESSIADVWNSPKASGVRRLYAEGRMDLIPLCRECAICDTTEDGSFR